MMNDAKQVDEHMALNYFALLEMELKLKLKLNSSCESNLIVKTGY